MDKQKLVELNKKIYLNENKTAKSLDAYLNCYYEQEVSRLNTKIISLQKETEEEFEKNKIKEKVDLIHSDKFPEFIRKLDLFALTTIIGIWEDGRATNYQDAINLYFKEKKDEEFREEMRDFEREKIRIQENAEKERMYELRRSQEQAQREMEYHNRQMQDIAKKQADESKRHNDEMEKSAKRLEKMAKEQGEKSNENITIRDYGSIGGGKRMFDIERKKKS